jgi:hypothetical protein
VVRVQDQEGRWVFLIPVSNLELTCAVNFEVKIDKVTFVSAQHLPRRRRRFGIPRCISELRRRSQGVLDRFFDGVETFAVVQYKGVPRELESRVLEIAKDETAILTLSQLGYAKRRLVSAPEVTRDMPIQIFSYLAQNTQDTSWYQSAKRVDKLLPLQLDGDWRNYQCSSFWYDLLRILRREIRVKGGWRKDLRNAAVLAGQSQVSLDVPQAFLWNVIALELLLTTQGDKYRDALPSRAEAFLGWMGHWDKEHFKDRIVEIYKKRSTFVHTGRRDEITSEDLFFTDDLLLNLFLNIVGHHSLFRSKGDVVEFAKRVEAERILNINAKVRPKTLRYVQRSYKDEDYCI